MGEHKPWCEREHWCYVSDDGVDIRVCICDSDPRTQGERRDGKDRRAWNKALRQEWEARNDRSWPDRRQTDRRQGGEG